MSDAMMTDDMSWREFGDAMKEAGKQRRAGNRESSAALLSERGIAFQSKNDGAHLVVSHAGKVADLWPGTGKYRIRRPGGKGEVYRRGVFNLIRELERTP
jgi:hypothetical protein